MVVDEGLRIADQSSVDALVHVRRIVERPPEKVAFLDAVLFSDLLPVASLEQSIRDRLWIVASVNVERLNFALRPLFRLFLNSLCWLDLRRNWGCVLLFFKAFRQEIREHNLFPRRMIVLVI